MTIDVKYRIPGNDQVIEGLEMVLARVRHGQVRAAGVIVCENAATEAVYLGDQNARPNVIFGCEMLKHTVMTSVARVHSTVNRPPANLVAYDLNRDPISFDFIPWLASAEMTRRREQAPAPLRVSFVANSSSLTDNHIKGQSFLANVMRPALALFDAVEGIEGEKARQQDFVGLRDLARAYAEGEPIPQIVVPPDAAERVRHDLKDRTPVTFTLRETHVGEQRNSNIDEWRRLAGWLRGHGEDIVVVRDTARADEPFDTHEISPQASRDLHYRIALYHQAKCNMFVQNGPFSLMPYTKAPWMLFAMVDDSQPEDFNRPENWQMVNPINKYGQYPWATEKQRIVYGRDNFEIMARAYEELDL
jgi:hypothetical protein